MGALALRQPASMDAHRHYRPEYERDRHRRPGDQQQECLAGQESVLDGLEHGHDRTIMSERGSQRFSVAEPVHRSEQRQQEPAQQRDDAEHHQRRPDPRCRLVRVGGGHALRLAREGHHPHARHVESSHPSGEQDEERREQHPRGAVDRGGGPDLGDDALLGPETADQRQTDDRRRADRHGGGGDRQLGRQATHVAHVLRIEVVIVITGIAHVIMRVMHLVDDRTGRHEQHPFRHRVVEQVEHRGAEGDDRRVMVIVVEQPQRHTEPGEDVCQLAHR